MTAVGKFLRSYWPSALIVCVILYATWLPGHLEPSNLPKIPHLDKLIHAVMFGGLTGAILFDRRRGGTRLNSGIVLATAAGTLAFGAVDEWVQGLLPIGRPSDILDLCADAAGIIVATLTAPAVVNAIFRKHS